MTTTTTFKGMEPGTKNSSRVLRPPGGASSFSLGTDEDTTPSAKARWPPASLENLRTPMLIGGTIHPAGHLQEPSRGSPQPRSGAASSLFSSPRTLSRTDHHPQLGAAMVWSQRQEMENGQEQANDATECPDDGEQQQQQEEQQQQQQKEMPQPSEPSGGAGRRNPPGGKSSLVLG